MAQRDRPRSTVVGKVERETRPLVFPELTVVDEVLGALEMRGSFAPSPSKGFQFFVDTRHLVLEPDRVLGDLATPLVGWDNDRNQRSPSAGGKSIEQVLVHCLWAHAVLSVSRLNLPSWSSEHPAVVVVGTAPAEDDR